MNLRKFWIALGILAAIGIVFYLGFLYGNREKVDASEDKTTVVGPNLSVQNSLTQIETRNIYGAVETQNIQVLGQLYYKLEDDNRTEILIKLENIPAKIRQSSSKKEKPIPTELEIFTAKRSFDGQDYDYTKVGKIIFDEPRGNVRAGRFSTIVLENLANIERIMLFPVKPEEDSIFTDTSADLPLKVRQRPAPYFWIVI
jgi:hypothetical protein